MNASAFNARSLKIVGRGEPRPATSEHITAARTSEADPPPAARPGPWHAQCQPHGDGRTEVNELPTPEAGPTIE